MTAEAEKLPQPQRIVIAPSSGSLAISRECAEWMAERDHEGAAKMLAQAEDWDYWYGFVYGDNFARDDAMLVAAVEALGEASGHDGCVPKIVVIPAGVAWEVHEGTAGCEWIAEKHRTWS